MEKGGVPKEGNGKPLRKALGQSVDYQNTQKLSQLINQVTQTPENPPSNDNTGSTPVAGNDSDND